MKESLSHMPNLIAAPAEVTVVRLGLDQRLLQNTQQTAALALDISKKFSEQKSLLPTSQVKLQELSAKMIDVLISDKGIEPKEAAQIITTQLAAMAERLDTNKFSNVIDNLHKLTFDELSHNSPKDLSGIRNQIAIDLLFEISDPKTRINQGNSNACAVTSREYLSKNPDIYTEFIADIVTKGHGYIGRTESGVKVGLFDYKEGLLNYTTLNSRTLGNAIYQNIMLKNFGSLAEGLMPADIERFLESRGRACKVYTADESVSVSTQNLNSVIAAVQACIKDQHAALLSVEFEVKGVHNKHVLELGSQDGVPAGYIKLTNPWPADIDLPEQYQKMVEKSEDGTFLIKVEDLKKVLYFAVVETGKEADLGKTAGVKEGQYSQTYEASDFGQYPLLYDFIQYKKDQEDKDSKRAKDLRERIPKEDKLKDENLEEKKLKNEEVDKTAPETIRSQAVNAGSQYFSRLSTDILFRN